MFEKNESRTLLELYYRDLTAKAISEELGISRKRVNQELLAMRIKLKMEVYPERMISAMFSTFEQELRSNVRFSLLGKSCGKSKAKAYLIYEANKSIYTYPILNCSNYGLKKMTAYLSKMHSSLGIVGMKKLGVIDYSGKYSFLNNPSDNAEKFINFSKERFRAVNGISNRHFSLHLAEVEYRFKNRRKNLAKEVFELMNNDLPF